MRAPPVVLLGGTGMPGYAWQYLGQVAALSEPGFRPVTLDRRCRGQK